MCPKKRRSITVTFVATAPLLLMAGVFIVATALAEEGGRSLPVQEPMAVIEDVMLAEAGELHFTRTEGAEKQRSVFLRIDGGAVCRLERVDGGANCLEPKARSKSARAESNCALVFAASVPGCAQTVLLSELQEGSLFDVVRSAHRNRTEDAIRAQ